MNAQRQTLHRSLALLSSLFFPVFILGLIDVLNFVFLPHFKPVFLFACILKVYFMAAIAGCILEILAGEEYVLRLRRFSRNARELWPGFLFAVVIVLSIDFILFALFGHYSSWRPFYYILIEVAAAFFLACWSLHKKYIRPLKLAVCPFKPDLNFFVVILITCLLGLGLEAASHFIQVKFFYWHHLTAFLLDYLQVFAFVFCASNVLDLYPGINAQFGQEKEVFLINPMFAGIFQGVGFWAARGYPPFFVVLKALSSKIYKFREFDQVLWHDRYYKKGALVCITCFTSNSYEAYKLAKEFKKRGSTVVMGGPHVTFFPSEALAYCDSVVIGGAEGVWKQLLEDHEKGQLKAQYKGPATDADFRQVYGELINSPPSELKEFLETSRGCKFRCHFCTIPANSQGTIHFQAISDFVSLIKKVKPYEPDVTFIDNNIYSDPAYARELFTALKDVGIKWRSECSIDIGKNVETLKLARESGCQLLGIGYEIFGASQEKAQGGKFAMARKFLEYSRNIKKVGIKIKGQFIYGFDSDNLKTLAGLWTFVFRLRPMVTALSVLTPLPGAGVYRDMLRENRLITLNWRSYTCHKLVVRHPVLNPRLMTFSYPFLQVLFFLTTSSLGQIVLGASLINFFSFHMLHLFLK